MPSRGLIAVASLVAGAASADKVPHHPATSDPIEAVTFGIDLIPAALSDDRFRDG